MDDEKLIDIVEKYPMLYDKNNKDYRNTTKKKIVWQKIAAIVDSDENAVTKRWINLRDRYGREIRYTKQHFTKRWMLMDRLNYLKKHIVPRPLRRVKTPTELPKYEENSSVSMGSPVQRELSPEDPLFEPSESPLLEPAACQSPTSTIASFPELAQRKISASEMDNAMLEAIKMLHQAYEEKPRQEEIGAEIKGFLTMIGATISNLKKLNQARVMQRCTEIVMQAQVEEEEENSMYFKTIVQQN